MFIFNEIKEDPVFQNQSRNPQAPIEYQLMVALYRFGHHGNGGSAKAVARTFQISGRSYTLTKVMSGMRLTTSASSGAVQRVPQYCGRDV